MNVISNVRYYKHSIWMWVKEENDGNTALINKKK
jgi:hypothetical protein